MTLATRVTFLLLLCCIVLAESPVAHAQSVPPVEPADADMCEDGRISEIFVDAHSIFDLTEPGLDDRFHWAYRLVNRLHIPTEPGVVRRELLFEAGDCYDLERMRDSERLLRALPFIAEVDIFGVRQADGSFHVVVDTRDEWSKRVEPRVSSSSTGRTGISVREDNLVGSGTHASAWYYTRDGEQSWGAALWTPQFLGTRWDAALAGGVTETGYLAEQSLTYPFVGQVGRWSLHQSMRHHDDYFEFRVPGTDDELLPFLLPQRRRALDVGAAYRWGTRGTNRTLLGAGVSAEWVFYPEGARFGGGAGEADLPPHLPEVALDSVASVRVLLMTGQRNVQFVRRSALETVNATEDVRLGVEAELVLAPTIVGASTDRDLALQLSLFASGEAGPVLSGARVVVEARRDYEAPADESEWSDVFSQLDAWAYWRPTPDSRHTVMASLRGAGGWHNVTPFQLTIGRYTGLRGFPGHLYPGGRRLVASLEHRAYLRWPLPELFDFGTAAFVDAGKIWRGDAEFGVESPLLVNAGIGIRSAFPPGSRRTIRLDVAMPVMGSAGRRGPVFSVGIGQAFGTRTLPIDPQLQRSVRMGAAAPAYIFATEP